MDINSTKLNILELYTSNYLAQYHIREIAKLLKKNHTTLLPHINSLIKNNILISKTIGKNKILTLNFNILTKNYLLLTETNKTNHYLIQNFQIKKIIIEIFKLNLEGTIVLFGSYAKKTFNKDSDIDLFYLGETKQLNKIKEIGKIYGKTINIKTSTQKNFNPKDHLITEIIKYHILLHNPQPFIDLLWKYYEERR